MLTTTQLSQVGNFDESTVNNLGRALGTTQAITAAGALSLSTYESTLAVSGTMAFTLAAPTVSGQRKRIVCLSAASTPLGTVTVTSPDDTAGFVCAGTFLFDAAGQVVELTATTALKWRATRIVRKGVRSSVCGTTVLTGMNLSLLYSLSVTGTVVSDSTKGLPNGSCAGERCSIVCDTAALSPIGSIAGTYKNMLGTAATDIQAIGVVASATAVGDIALLEWDGAAWQCIYLAGVTFA
jgi:hypothetical protein